MSKEAAMRAMREANYRKRAAGAATGSPSARPAVRAAKPVEPSAPAPAESGEPGDALCGHRSMNGRTCTREQGHESKSHRYS